MTNAQFERYYPKYTNAIQAIARKFAGADADLFDDLVQQGMIGLFEADLRRPFKNEDAFLRNVIRNRIVDHIRWLDPERYDRLDKHLAQGAQVVKDDATQEVVLVRPDAKRQMRNSDRIGGGNVRAGYQSPDPTVHNLEDDYDG